MLCFQEWLTEKFTDDVREYDLDLHVEQAYSEEEVCDMYDKYHRRLVERLCVLS